MKKNIWIGAAGIAVLAPALMALPQQSTPSSAPSAPDKDRVKVLRQELDDEPGRRTILISTNEEGGPSFLGIEAREVTPENVKQYNFQALRGVVVVRVA